MSSSITYDILHLNALGLGYRLWEQYRLNMLMQEIVNHSFTFIFQANSVTEIDIDKPGVPIKFNRWISGCVPTLPAWKDHFDFTFNVP